MIQKINFNDAFAIKGLGRVDDTRPIDLREYVIPFSRKRTPILPILKKIKTSKKIGKTVGSGADRNAYRIFAKARIENFKSQANQSISLAANNGKTYSGKPPVRRLYCQF